MRLNVCRCFPIATLVIVATLGCSDDAATPPVASPICSKCETDGDCAKQGTDLLCMPLGGGSNRHCSPDCAKSSCPDGLQCSLFQGGSSNPGTWGVCDLPSSCKPTTSKCENIANQIREVAAKDQDLVAINRQNNPCADPIAVTATDYHSACEQLTLACNGGCSDLC